MDAQYQVFISYSHDADQQLAAALQSSLSRFAKPRCRLRSMRVFRDKMGLAANPALWHSIEQALGESKYFRLLACPRLVRKVVLVANPENLIAGLSCPLLIEPADNR